MTNKDSESVTLTLLFIELSVQMNEEICYRTVWELLISNKTDKESEMTIWDPESRRKNSLSY